MAYKQNPGRGNHAKTGHGLPSPFIQDQKYKNIDAAENKSKSGKTLTMTAATVLKDYPEQQKHLIKNVTKDAGGKITSFEAPSNTKKAVEQLQIAKDSMSYLSGAKNEVDRMKLGKDFSRNYSTNSKEGRAKTGGTYRSPGSSASQTNQFFDNTLSNLMNTTASPFAIDENTASKNFGIGKVPAKTNPKSGVKGKKK